MELEEVKKGLKFVEEKGRYQVSYLFKGDLSLFQDNQKQMEKRAVSQENSLIKKGFLDDYNKVVDDYIKREVWVEVSDEEFKPRIKLIHLLIRRNKFINKRM